MIKRKNIARITFVLMCFCLIVCVFIVYAANKFDMADVPEYQKRLFGDEVATINIQVDKNDWQSLLDNAQAKEWIPGDLIINGERFSAVGIRTKGNSSLSQVGMSDSNRYSLQLKFNKFIKGQTYYGLDMFCLNNLMGDATYMKDYISYDIMNYIGVATPLTNYANVTVNDESYGFFIAVERYDKAFLDRVYNTSAGQLYNVKIQMGMPGDFGNIRQDNVNPFPFPGNQANGMDSEGMPPEDGNAGFPGKLPDGFDFEGMPPKDGNAGFPDSLPDNMDLPEPPGGFGGFGGQNGGGSLKYTDDDVNSYNAIFNNAVFSNNSDMDKRRVINAIKHLNAGSELEKYFDVDGILRYLAAHTVVVNLDSYISNMQQNYYIYERDGKITILPWDYGLAFGGFMAGNASSVVNFPIDTPVSGVSMEDRPLINILLEVDEYREKYHIYLRQIVEGYFESGIFEKTIIALDAKINQYIKNDVSVFYTFEQYEESLPVLIELGRLRALSIKGQLDGIIPSTSSGQKDGKLSLVDASSVNLSALGSMMGGMGRDGFPGGQDGMPGGGIDMQLMPLAMQILMKADGELTGGVKEELLDLGLTGDQITILTDMRNRFSNMENANFPPGMNRPDRHGTDMAAQTRFDIGNCIIIVILLIILMGVTKFVSKPLKNEL